MPNHKSTLRIKTILGMTALVFFSAGKSYGFPASFYADNSALSEGQWAKIEVTETGVQFISDATLRNLGFPDPEKVNVYGYGGEMIPESMDSPDDLPLVGSLRVNGGIVFFGKGSVTWTGTGFGTTQYSHTSNPYSDKSYYFVSDVATERKSPKQGEVLTSGGSQITEFTQRLLHEQDLSVPMFSGRLMLGEDFRTNPSRNFKFQLPGNIGDAVVTTAFGCKTSSGSSSIVLTANGRQLPSESTDIMGYSDSKLVVMTKTVKTVENPGTSLDLGIKFNSGVGLTIAGLDYIEVEYPRALNVSNGDLYFYVNPPIDSEVIIEGAGASTQVWDVTDAINPVLMPATLNGSTLHFVSGSGYKEYVAFDPSKITRAALPGSKVSNQNIHAMQAPGMLLISPPEYLTAAQRIVDLHKITDGLDVLVLTPEEIYNEFSSGKPDVTAFRKLLKMWYDRSTADLENSTYTKYCLIMSRPTYDNKMVTLAVQNAGYPRVPIWQSPTGETETTTYSTDDYIGMLGDAGEAFNIGTAQIHVAVGRMPVKSLSEANSAIDKLEDYLLNPDLGAWKNNVMIIADDQDKGTHLNQAETVYRSLTGNEFGKSFIYEKLYLDSYPLEYTGVGASYPQAKERMLNKWNEGLAYIDYIGHANPKSWGHEYLFTWPDINAMSNTRLPFLYAATCEFLRWDEDDISGAEVLWLLPSSGIIASICPSREVLITANGVLNQSTARYMFERDGEGKPLTCGEIMIKGKNASNTGTNKLRYGLIGDPSMRMPWPVERVIIDSVNGVELETAEELPILSARSNVTVSGHLEDEAGNPLSDFNGIAEITLFDAEKVITTNGNGSDGVVSLYNDRKTRLFVGRTKVVNGEWSTSFSMPSEIENNYAPALLSVYAYEDTGRDANGYTEKIYAYGYDTTAPDDFEGPKIIEFYIGSPSFTSGDQVSPNPTLYAKFHDESGISVSEAGIGHNITLELDGTTFFEDVAQYYIPDENEPGTGSVTYALNDISQGLHSLKFTVWDNANNSTSAELDFSISALWKPSIETLTTDVNPATSSVNFIVATDGSTSTMDCSIEVFDLWGKRVWRQQAPSFSKSSTRTTLGWDLCDSGGSRVPGGVYLYKATVKTDVGATVTKTRKLIVKGQ